MERPILDSNSPMDYGVDSGTLRWICYFLGYLYPYLYMDPIYLL